jgi:hypothetical protein
MSLKLLIDAMFPPNYSWSCNIPYWLDFFFSLIPNDRRIMSMSRATIGPV